MGAGRRSWLELDAHNTEDHRGFHARFATTAGAQAQVDWGEEGTITTPAGDVTVYSFHMVLSYSRDPFCRYTTSTDLATFWACHREAFAHGDDALTTAILDRLLHHAESSPSGSKTAP